jgi:hypothetical protein
MLRLFPSGFLMGSVLCEVLLSSQSSPKMPMELWLSTPHLLHFTPVAQIVHYVLFNLQVDSISDEVLYSSWHFLIGFVHKNYFVTVISLTQVSETLSILLSLLI